MTQIGVNYGCALYELAQQESLCEAVLGQLQVLEASFRAEPGYLRLLSTPNLSKEERLDVVEKSFREKVHPYVLNFLKILTEKGYAKHFSDCCKAYEDRYNEDHGILPVQAVTAVPLTEEQSRKLTQKLESLTGKTVKLQNTVDESCLGGVRLLYDGVQVDGTVKNRLDSIGDLLKNTVL